MKKLSKEEQLEVIRDWQSKMDPLISELESMIQAELDKLTDEERKVFLDEVARNNSKQ